MQLYTACALYGNWCFSCIFALLPNKRQETYVRMLSKIIELVIMTPTRILVDFEAAAISALRATLPMTLICGCYFHYCQAIYRKMCELGFQQRYAIDAAFRLEIRKLMALAFVPRDKVTDTFCTIAEALPDDVQDLVDYMERTWVGWDNDAGDRVPPRFAISLWSVYDRVSAPETEHYRTNNAAERFHHSFNTFVVQTSHPSMLNFVDHLKTRQRLTQYDLEAYKRGDEATVPPRFEKLNKRLRNLMDRYTNNANENALVDGIARAYAYVNANN